MSPLEQAVIAKCSQDIWDNELEIVRDLPIEARIDYARPLKEQRIQKLKKHLLSLRSTILKKDFTERNLELQTLEQSTEIDLDAWKQAYRKAKVKIKGEKIVESP